MIEPATVEIKLTNFLILFVIVVILSLGLGVLGGRYFGQAEIFFRALPRITALEKEVDRLNKQFPWEIRPEPKKGNK